MSPDLMWEPHQSSIYTNYVMFTFSRKQKSIQGGGNKGGYAQPLESP